MSSSGVVVVLVVVLVAPLVVRLFSFEFSHLLDPRLEHVRPQIAKRLALGLGWAGSVLSLRAPHASAGGLVTSLLAPPYVRIGHFL